jgi:hypothetical protein
LKSQPTTDEILELSAGIVPNWNLPIDRLKINPREDFTAKLLAAESIARQILGRSTAREEDTILEVGAVQ